MNTHRKLLILDVAALGYDFLRGRHSLQWEGLAFKSTSSVFPAVTCTVQASFRTASPVGEHGMVANGRYFRHLHKPMFWEQSADLVQGRRIWDDFRDAGGTVGVMFWQQSLGERADLVYSPAPIHTHGGGMIMDCYAQPRDLSRFLHERAGGKFRLHRYWGPLASAKVGDWIARAVSAVLTEPDVAPDLLLAYLPSLDYDLQRFGPDHPKSRAALDRTLAQMEQCLSAARRGGYEVLIFGDYAIGPCTGEVVYPNRALAEAGLLAVREIKGMLYPDFHASRAFAMVDHEVAHVYVADRTDLEHTEAVLAELPGVAEVLDAQGKAQARIDHPAAGELVLLSAPGNWLAYPWWTRRRQAPDYASHIDIHNKPGFDPCELFFGWPPPGVSQNTARISGSHGQLGPDRDVAWATTLPIDHEPADLTELAEAVRQWLTD